MAGLLGSPIASAYILRPSIAEIAILDTAENLWSVFEIIVKVCLYPYVDLYIVKQMSASKSIVCLLDPLIDLLPQANWCSEARDFGPSGFTVRWILGLCVKFSRIGNQLSVRRFSHEQSATQFGNWFGIIFSENGQCQSRLVQSEMDICNVGATEICWRRAKHHNCRVLYK